MIETTIPEINVSELMERVRAKVEVIRQTQVRPKLPPLAAVKEIATVIVPKPVTLKTEQILRATQTAREATTVSRWIPRPLRGLFRRQDKFNREMLRAIESLSSTNAQFVDRLQHLIACAEVQNHGLQHLAEVRRADGEWMNEVARIRDDDAAWMQGAGRLLSSIAGHRLKVLSTTNALAQQIAAVEEKNLATEQATASVASDAHELEQKFGTMDSRLATLAEESGCLLDLVAAFEQRSAAVEEKNLATEQATASVASEAHELEQKFGTMDSRLATLAEESGRLRDLVAAFQQRSLETNGRVDDVVRRTADVDEKIATIDQESGRLRDLVASFEQRIGGVADHLTTVAGHGDQLAIETNNVHTEHNALAEAVRGLRGEFNNAAEHLRNLQVQADRVTAVAAALQGELANRAEQDKQLGEQLRAETAQRAAIRQGVESLEQRHTSDSAFIKAELSRQSGLVHKLIDRTSVRTPTKSKRAADGELSEAAAHRLDAFYFSFENRFRGPREEIKKRMRFYLPLVENCRAGKQGRPIVDLGCGRGEWLELLREQKLTAMGVDLNETMIDQCKERRLNVIQADAVEFLRRLPDDSHGAITGFHIIEHLPLDTLVDLIAETFRVLQPGGLAIFESPNCKNLTVGACYFYIDPTHRNPVFPETAQFMLETKGFERVTLEYLHPAETTDVKEIDEQPAHLRELLYGPRDFGVIGYKPIPQMKGVNGRR